MSTTKHTAEPWRVDSECPSRFETINGITVGSVAHPGCPSYEVEDATCRRIVACVNACAGLDDPTVLRAVLDACREDLRRYSHMLEQQAQRDGNGFIGLDSLRALGG